MFVSNERHRRCGAALVAFTIVLIAGVHASVNAQGSIGAAETFVRIAYDEIVNDETVGVSVTVGHDPIQTPNVLDWSRMPQVQVQLGRNPQDFAAVTGQTQAPLLSVSLKLDPLGRIFEVRSRGRYVHTQDLEEMVAFASARSAWSDQSLAAELKRRGARFTGNVEEFMQAVRLIRYEPIIGRITKTEVRFDLRSPRPGAADYFGFVCVADVETEPSPSERMRYVFVFEPFDGRLMRLHRNFYEP